MRREVFFQGWEHIYRREIHGGIFWREQKDGNGKFFAGIIFLAGTLNFPHTHAYTLTHIHMHTHTYIHKS